MEKGADSTRGVNAPRKAGTGYGKANEFIWGHTRCNYDVRDWVRRQIKLDLISAAARTQRMDMDGRRGCRGRIGELWNPRGGFCSKRTGRPHLPHLLDGRLR